MAEPAWVLLRGLTREAGHWGPLWPALQAAQPQAACVALDLPGNGRLHRQPSPWRVEAMTEACRAELRRRGIAPPWRLLAMSLGAMVAVDWALRHPAELAGAVLVNTSLRPFSPLPQRLRPAQWPRLLRLALAPAAPATWERAVLAMTSRRDWSPAERAALLAQWCALRERHPVSRLNALRQLVAAASYRAPRRAPAVPLLVLNGGGDRLVHPACSQRLAAAWGCPLRVHPWAGHDLPLDDPGWVLREVLDWTAAPAGAGAPGSA